MFKFYGYNNIRILINVVEIYILLE